MFLFSNNELKWTAIRAQGSGGQNVNKVATAIHLRFDIGASTLPEAVKQRLLALHDHRISSQGIVVIKAQKYRTQDKNRADALARLQELVESVSAPPRSRKPTKPTKGAQMRRIDGKIKRGQLKVTRNKAVYET